MSDSNPVETFSYMAHELSAKQISYLHVVEAVSLLANPGPGVTPLTPILRQIFKGTLIVNEDYDRDTAELSIERGTADLVSFGIPFLANPDLPKRFERSAPSQQARSFYSLYSGITAVQISRGGGSGSSGKWGISGLVLGVAG